MDSVELLEKIGLSNVHLDKLHELRMFYLGDPTKANNATKARMAKIYKELA